MPGVPPTFSLAAQWVLKSPPPESFIGQITSRRRILKQSDSALHVGSRRVTMTALSR
jgi:hypothetical protein